MHCEADRSLLHLTVCSAHVGSAQRKLRVKARTQSFCEGGEVVSSTPALPLQMGARLLANVAADACVTVKCSVIFGSLQAHAHRPRLAVTV